MKKLHFFFFSGILIFMFFDSIWSQTAILSGTVKDTKNNPLIGANVILVGTTSGASTDNKGEFKFTSLKYASYQIEVSMVGYKKFTSDKIDISSNEIQIDIVLEETALLYDQIIVTAGKYKQDISELPVSASLIKSKDLMNNNRYTLDQALRYVPGVYITLDQVSIRGSSGYSRGVGTRVLLAIDGIPLYTGDSGEIIWDIIPVTDLERVEIIKGAASSLYGSTAIGGVINVITKNVSANPLTYIYTYGGAYDKPEYDEWDWSDKIRTFHGITVAHTNSIDNFGYSFSISRRSDDGYRENDWYRRYAGYLKTKYNFSGNLSVTLLGTGLSNRRGTFNYWMDSRSALVPPEADRSDRTTTERYMAGLIVDNIISADFSYNLKASLYNNFWQDESESANSSTSNLYRFELQTDYTVGQSIHLISGGEVSFGKVESNIFRNPASFGTGVYSQIELKIIPKTILTAGARFDYNKLDTLESSYAFSPKIGLNFKADDNTIFRMSIAKGFRAPSLAEAFTSTVTSGITVKPNPKIKSETNYSFEIGINKNLSPNLNFDAAVFQSEYFNFIEPQIDPSDGKIIFDNVTRARIQGIEIISKYRSDEINSEMSVGYTYLWARDVELNKPLKYRPRHLFYFNYGWSPSIFELNFNFRYWSRVEEIDQELIDLGFVKDGEKRVEVGVFDLSAGVNLYSSGIPAKLFLNLKNLFNYNYVEMIGNISPIRNISLNLETIF